MLVLMELYLLVSNTYFHDLWIVRSINDLFAVAYIMGFNKAEEHAYDNL